MEQQNLVSRAFKPLLVRAGLPAIRFHDLRHSAATLLLMQGVHPKVVQERLGHATIGVTMDTYSHVLPSMQQDAASKLEAFLADPPAPEDGVSRPPRAPRARKLAK
jgi:integrase